MFGLLRDKSCVVACVGVCKLNFGIHTFHIRSRIHISVASFWLEMDPETRGWLHRLFTAWRASPSCEWISFFAIAIPRPTAALPDTDDYPNDEPASPDTDDDPHDEPSPAVWPDTDDGF